MERVYYGGDYYPEHWPDGIWEDDRKLMAEAAVSLVTVGIFSWAQVEPRPGEFDFGKVDQTLDNLAEAGIRACLATMTASPPPWLSHQHPEILPVRADGTRLSAGARQQFCPSSPVFRRYAARLVDRVATRYADHPALELWHIGNEFGCHIRECYCEASAVDFRRWLAERYGTIDALNAAWSTTFWSQRYSGFAEIEPPRVAPTFPNPAHKLDFHRFSSDASLGAYLNEREILARITPDVPVTTNFVGLVQKSLDWHKWVQHEDIVSLDSYPDPYDARSHLEAAFGYDLVRSLKGGQPWLLMEQATSAVNWRTRNSPKPPGTMRLGSWQAVARGADSVLFFQWRQTPGGAEKFHSAMVPHGGADTRIFREVRELGQELASAPQIAGSRVQADVAILHDWNSWWALELNSHPSDDLTQLDAHLAHYAPFFDANITCDVVHPSHDLSGYRLVVVPNLYLMDRAVAANLRSYVEGGGHLAVSFFSGIADENDRVYEGGYPAPLRDLLGLRVDEFWPLPEGGSTTMHLDGTRAGASVWSEWIESEGADIVATFAEGPLAGRPAVTRNEFGSGVAWYLGTRPDPTVMRTLFDRITAEADVSPVLPGLPDGVQAVVRRGGTDYLFLLNHNSVPVTVSLPSPGTDVLTDPAPPSSEVDLAPYGVAVLSGQFGKDAR
ncbi:beta-galactosidase [Amycolatopsis benzoatilytica]|uniref:beta-galactosidase n=1 Tax=Amycolatopsis benzoatilytica TaxID=346045 RepID=UPI000364D449|nr:beta-galactosidase [Amycolatopsis benzoatilytica]